MRACCAADCLNKYLYVSFATKQNLFKAASDTTSKMLCNIGRKNPPVTSTHQCFHLIYIQLYHMGCLGCETRNEKELYYNKKYTLYAYLYRITYLTGLIGGCSYKMMDAELHEAVMSRLTPVIKVTLSFECIICPTVYLVITFFLDIHRETYVKLANNLQELDDELHKHFPGIQWNYDKSKRKYCYMTVGIYGFYAIASTLYLFYVANCMCGWISSIIVSICYTCISAVPAFASFLFIGNMDLLRLRFRLIGKLIRHHLTHSDHMENVFKLKLLANYFKKYSSLITHINQVFCVVTVSSLFHDFAVLTSLGYLLCYKALDTHANVHSYVFTILFMTPRIYKVLSTAMYGYATQKARRNCEREIIKMGYLTKKSSLIQQETELFLHWRMQNNYTIKVGTILKCDLSLIFLILNSVVNYIVILIQLQFQQNRIVNKFTTDTELINKDN